MSGSILLLLFRDSPTVPHQIGDEMVEAFAPWMNDDFQDFIEAMCSMCQQVEQYVLDDPEGDGNDGWSRLLDIDQCPDEALPYLAQWVGEVIPTGIVGAAARQWVRDAPYSKRGTVEGIVKAAARSLVGEPGQRFVQILERTMPDGSVDPNGDNFVVFTLASQTPNPAQVWVDLLEAIPAEMHCQYETITGVTYASLEAGGTTYAALEAEYPTYGSLSTGRTGAGTWMV